MSSFSFGIMSSISPFVITAISFKSGVFADMCRTVVISGIIQILVNVEQVESSVIESGKAGLMLTRWVPPLHDRSRQRPCLPCFSFSLHLKTMLFPHMIYVNTFHVNCLSKNLTLKNNVDLPSTYFLAVPNAVCFSYPYLSPSFLWKLSKCLYPSAPPSWDFFKYPTEPSSAEWSSW